MASMKGIGSLHSSERFKLVIKKLEDNDELNQKQLPGLASLLTEIVDPKIEVPREDSVRRLLEVFWKSETDDTYSKILRRYQPDEKELFRDFVEKGVPASDAGEKLVTRPSLGARHELPIIIPEAAQEVQGDDSADRGATDLDRDGEDGNRAGAAITPVAAHDIDTTLYNDNAKKVPILVYTDKDFQNWGRTVQYKPHLTFVPETSYGILQIVKYAKSNGMNVRASGYRHSWSPIFGTDGQVTISTLGLIKATMLPNIESLPGSQFFDKTTELNSIDFVDTPQKGTNRFVRVGTAVTNEKLRRWCNEQELDAASTLPLNVIMVEITLGGSNAPICHGAGRQHSTLSDLVYAIEYVDANGDMQTLSKRKDPEFMTLAAGCFGLLGIVTHLTLELQPMRYAIMTPQKLPVMRAIPPPEDLDINTIPEALRINMTPEERKEAQATFEKHARDDFYSEWFWFPYTSKVWVNCWNIDPTDDPAGEQAYPSPGGIFLQWAETVAIQIIQNSSASLNLQQIFPWWQATLLSKMGLYSMPEVTNPRDAIKTKLPNALHFRRAIQNVQVRDMEIEIPLQPASGSLKDAKFTDKIDFSLVQRAWWDAILTAYKPEWTKTCPQRMPLEMRITGPSNVILAPYRGHTLGTCSIEVLTLKSMAEEWPRYAQDILDRWMELKGKDGKYLASRPHWAKEWEGMKVRNTKMTEYLKETYSDAIREFQDVFGRIAEAQKWDVNAARERFGNVVLNNVLWGGHAYGWVRSRRRWARKFRSLLRGILDLLRMR